MGYALLQSYHTSPVRRIISLAGINIPFIKGVLHLKPLKAPKLACFVLYLKIINISLKNNICILK